MEREDETIIVLNVPPGYHEQGRLDVYISRFIQNTSRNRVQQGIRGGRVTVNDRVVRKPSYAVQAGDSICCRIPRPPPMEVVAQDIPIDVVFEDDYLLVVNKPAGMVVHPGYGNRDGTLVNALLYYVGGSGFRIDDPEDEEEDGPEDEALGLSVINAVPARAGDPSIRPGIVHRLDKDTSGLLVVAKDDETHRGLARQFEERTIARRYIGLVWGISAPPTGTISTSLGRDPRDRKKMAVVAEGTGKHAVTHYETLEALRHTSLVAFRLETGRTHQIRVHAAHIGHPILGDTTYGGTALRSGPRSGRRQSLFRRLFEIMPRQALHAQSLGFVHPKTGESLAFTSHLPVDMQTVLERIREEEGA